MRQTHGDHTNAPEDHDDGDENARTEALEQDVGQRFEEGVGDEEDGQASVVLAAGDVEAFLEAIELGVADIGAVEEGDEVEEAEPGDQTEVEFPEESAVLQNVSISCIVAPLNAILVWKHTMRAFSSSLRPASGSGGSSPRPSVSKPPCSTPTTLSLSSIGEWVLSLSLCSLNSFIVVDGY